MHKLRGAFKVFVISGHFDAIHGLGVGLGLGSGMLTHTLVRFRQAIEDIMNSELRIGPWNYMSALTKVKHEPVYFFQKLCIIYENKKS